MIKGYKIIKFPYSGKFSSLSNKEAKELFEWFLKEIPIRLSILMNTIKNDDLKTFNKLDYSRESLVYLMGWFEKHITTRKMTDNEIKKERDLFLEILGKNITSENWTYTEETFSLCYDIGIYLANVFQKNNKKVRWYYFTSPKSNIYVNQPIISMSRMGMSPFNIIHVFMMKLHEKSETKESILSLYDTWEELHRKHPPKE